MSHLRRPLLGALLLSAPLWGVPVFSQTLMLTGPDGQVPVLAQGGEQYGPTTRSDTLWRIANEVRPDSSVTVYQVMQALFEANPHAFNSDNFNSLERNRLLIIPAVEVIKGYPANEAKASAADHDDNWDGAPVAETAAAQQPQQADNRAASTKVVASSASSNNSDLQLELAQLREQNQRYRQELDEQKAALLQLQSLRQELDNNTAEMAQLVRQNALLQQQMEQLSQELSLLRSALDEQQSLNRALEQELDAQRLTAANGIATSAVVNEPLDAPQPSLWQTISDSTLLLVLIGAIPLLLVITGLVIWNTRRQRHAFKNPIQDGDLIAPLATAPDPLTQMVPAAPQANQAATVGAGAALAGAAYAAEAAHSDFGSNQSDPFAAPHGGNDDDSMTLEQLLNDAEFTSAAAPTNYSNDFDQMLAAATEQLHDASDSADATVETPSHDAADNRTEASHHSYSSDSVAATSDSYNSSDFTSDYGSDSGFIDIDKLLAESDDAPSFSSNYESDSVAPAVSLMDDDGGYSAKLDLARAYIEIEDIDAAKALLNEVANDGNQQQQSEAQTLLAQL
ncbi:FimV/HubP family polar landmark protein [Ferrimonas senticii]|uniref:FimV/HubP family polar landmark protein n=1 Tax=Ferrimonas senticii TaxID=394566 RepID=UPI0004070005|nr:FimV/HubP family polar landmark protein [Ferrimonas senticii]